MDRREAIEIIIKNYPHVSNSGSQFESALRELIPELAESEEERIRKALLRCCDDWEKGQFGCMKSEDVPAIRAYLEKQKEPLTPEEKMNHPLYLEGFDVGKKVGEVLKEQKPLSTEETELNSIAFLEQLGYTCVPPGVKQKPAEWSEEDKKNRHPLNTKEIKVGDIITYFRDGKKGIMLVSSFDSGVYPRCKWGITDIDGTAYGDWAPSSGPYYIATEKEKQQLYDTMPIEVKNWFKSFRPQPHWKPSEEQMEWLESAVRLSTDKPHIHGIIISLYEQLKRLL